LRISSSQGSIELVKQAIAAGKVEAYPGSVALLRKLREIKVLMAVVSSSNNCEEVLEAAGIADFFAASGPATFVHRVDRLRRPPPMPATFRRTTG
jgi:beta-phosphoglucomutase-like phosphatase (HAD superfamily)